MKHEEGRGISGRYWHPGDSIINGLFPDTDKFPANEYCDHLSDNPGTLSLLGENFTTPSLDSNVLCLTTS